MPLPKPPNANGWTAALAGQITAWVAIACEKLTHGQWAFWLILAPTFFVSVVYLIGGREAFDSRHRRLSFAQANELGGHVGTRLLIWFGSASVAVVVRHVLQS